MNLSRTILLSNQISRRFESKPILLQALWSIFGITWYYIVYFVLFYHFDVNHIIFLLSYSLLFILLAYNILIVIIKFESNWKQWIILPLAILAYSTVRVIISIIVNWEANRGGQPMQLWN